MRQLICLLFIVGVAFTITGCDAEKVKELSAKVQDLEKKNQELQDKNKKLEIDLAVAKSELGKANDDLKAFTAMKKQIGDFDLGGLTGDLKEKLTDVIKNQKNALDAVKDTPEGKGLNESIDDLLDKFGGKDKKAPEKKKPADK